MYDWRKSNWKFDPESGTASFAPKFGLEDPHYPNILCSL
jgi:hypothetical protein